VPGGSVLASCPKAGTATDDAAAAAAARRKLRRSICVSSDDCVSTDADFSAERRVVAAAAPSKPGRRISCLRRGNGLAQHGQRLPDLRGDAQAVRRYLAKARRTVRTGKAAAS